MPVRPRRAAAIREQIGALGNRERGQEQGEPHGEVLVAPHSPFEPANGLGARKARRLLGLSPEPSRPFRGTLLRVQYDVEREEAGQHHSHAEELPEMTAVQIAFSA